LALALAKGLQQIGDLLPILQVLVIFHAHACACSKSIDLIWFFPNQE
jgi:hypothetical protein